jgi:hypothetical protein
MNSAVLTTNAGTTSMSRARPALALQHAHSNTPEFTAALHPQLFENTQNFQ